MTTIGLIGAGHMGSGLGWALRDGGHDVVTTLAGRSARTGRLVRQAGIVTLPDLRSVVEAAGVLLIVTPPGAAIDAAESIAATAAMTRARPLVADLNAISPSTVERVAETLGRAGFNLVDGAISGPPPTVRPGATIFLSGPGADRVAELAWCHVRPVVVGEVVGAASAVKMCTASVYKGVVAVLTQALRTAAHHEVVDHVLADLAGAGYEPTRQIAVAATKAWRYVPEMREIATTQRAAHLPGELFDAMAMVYEELALTELAAADPETVDPAAPAAQIVARLTTKC